MRGSSHIPELRLERINKLVTTFMTPPQMVLSKLFGSDRADSDVIKWESQRGNRGMAPFVAPEAPAPRHAPVGVAQHSAGAAYYKEKSFYGEAFLNNLRKEGTQSQYLSARKRLSRDLKSMRGRNDRRTEWMFAQMLTAGTFEYLEMTGTKLSVDYSLDSNHVVTLGADFKWENGTQRDVLRDIMDGKILIHNDCNGIVDIALCDSTILKFMALDASIQTLLQKSAFGQGDLFNKVGGKLIGVNAKVLGNLLDIKNLVVYDEKYEVTAWLTAAVTGGSTTVVSVDNPADFVVGGTLRFWDVSAGTYEDETIASIQTEAGTVTVSTAPTASFKAGEDKVTMTQGFLPTTKFVMFASAVDGQKIAEFKQAPFGLGRHFGVRSKSWDDPDPEGTWVMVENKGLPVLYQRDALYVLTVN